MLKSIQYLNSFIIKVILCLNIKVISEVVEGTVVPENISRGVEGYDCIASCPGSAPIVFLVIFAFSTKSEYSAFFV